MGKMQQFKREIRSVNGKMLAFDMRNGFGAVLGGLFEQIARGKVSDKAVLETFGLERGEKGAYTERVRTGPILAPSATRGKYTAVVTLHGTALYNLEWQPMAFSTRLLSQTLDQLANDPSIDQIVLDINTPGGHVTGTAEAADAVWAARKKKPVIGIINPLCASAGYWIGSQCSKLIAVPSADVGSIGVFMCHYDCSAMLADAGIKPTFIYAGEHKVEGNSMEPLSEEARSWFQSEVDQTYRDFIAAVARGRGVSSDDVLEKFGKGRCYSAQMAKRVGMIDEIQTVKMALKGVGLTLEMPQYGEASIDLSAETEHPDVNAVDEASSAAEPEAVADESDATAESNEQSVEMETVEEATVAMRWSVTLNELGEINGLVNSQASEPEDEAEADTRHKDAESFRRRLAVLGA